MGNFSLDELKRCVVKATMDGEENLLKAYLRKYDSKREATRDILIEEIFDECNKITKTTIRAGMSKEDILRCIELTKEDVEYFLTVWNDFVTEE